MTFGNRTGAASSWRLFIRPIRPNHWESRWADHQPEPQFLSGPIRPYFSFPLFFFFFFFFHLKYFQDFLFLGAVLSAQKEKEEKHWPTHTDRRGRLPCLHALCINKRWYRDAADEARPWASSPLPSPVLIPLVFFFSSLPSFQNQMNQLDILPQLFLNFMHQVHSLTALLWKPISSGKIRFWLGQLMVLVVPSLCYKMNETWNC